MNRKTFTNGSRQVIASRNEAGSIWNARLYVNNGETATLVAGKFKSDAGLERWAAKQLSR